MAAIVKVEKAKAKRRHPQGNIPFPNSVDQAVIVTDLAGKVLFWNSAAEKVYNWKWDEAIGRAITELVVPEPEKGDAARIMKQLRQGKSWTGKFRLRRRDGSEFVATVTDQPILDTNGNLIGIMGISDCSHALKHSKGGRNSSVRSGHKRGRRQRRNAPSSPR